MPKINTLADFLQWSADYFEDNDVYYGHGTDNAWDEAVMLALCVLKLPADADRSTLDLPLDDTTIQRLVELATRRVEERIPIPYLTNEAWFAGERYYIDKNAIIPRSPFAELITNHFQPWLGNTDPQSILDLCTGSACMAIYCSKQFPNCKVDAIDISPMALAVASKNVELHNSPINLIQSDLFAALSPLDPMPKYDIIISNPPYVGAEEMATLPPEYLHEPTLALQSGEDGLELSERILREAKRYLKPHGLLIVEVGNSQEALVAKFPRLPFVWLEFAHGGEGVFLLRAEDL